MKKIINGRKLFWVVCGLIIAGVAAGMVLFNIWYMQSIQRKVRNTTISTISEITKGKADFLDEKIKYQLDSLKILEDTVAGMGVENISTRILESYERNYGMSEVIFVNAEGKGISSSGEDFEIPAEQYDYYAPALKGQTIMTDVLLGEMGKPQIIYETPVYQDGRIAGALYAKGEAQDLKTAFHRSLYHNDGYGYVLKSNGDIMLAPDSYGYVQIYGNGNINQVLQKDGNERQLIEEFIRALGSGRGGYAVFLLEEEYQVLYFQPLEEKKDWCFVSAIPLSLVESDGRAIVSSALMMTISIAGLVAVIMGMILFMVFYSGRKKRENDKFRKRIYEAISENIDTVIFILDAKTSRLEYVFENCRDILGISGQELMAEEENAENFKGRLWDILKKERPFRREATEMQIYNDIMGRDMWLSIKICRFHLNGSVKYMFAMTDMTEEHKIKEDLNQAVVAATQASHAKSQFLSNMSHDMRTPLNVITGMTNIAQMHIDEKNTVRDCLLKISYSSSHLLELINDILDMSKIESGKLIIEREIFRFSEMLMEIEAIVRPQCDMKKQEFSIEQHVIHEWVKEDMLHLKQVLLNLLSNAVKFTPEGGRITFSVQEKTTAQQGRAGFLFEVRDTGIGISQEFMNRIFQPFEREQDSKVSQIQGTGLGLVISRNIIEAMGGRILVNSEPGKGSCFQVEIEIETADPLPDCGKRRKSGMTKTDLGEAKRQWDFSGKKILLVEDNELNREIAEALLEVTGAKVVSTVNGKEGAIRYETSAPDEFDAILMDVQMPVMNGCESARRIRKSGHEGAGNIPIIAMTANVFAEDIRDTREAGMNGYVAKPVDPGILYQVLGEAMEGDGKEQ